VRRLGLAGVMALTAGLAVGRAQQGADSMKSLMDRGVALGLTLALTPAWLFLWVQARRRRVPMVHRQRVLGAGGAFELMGLQAGLVRSPVVARLPALLNVLRGEMSLVGPRPIEPSELRSHERWWSNLATMRPGLTGLWRLNPGDLSVEERVALDLYYVRNYSLALDVQILYLTARGLASRLRGAVGALARWHPEGQPVAEARPKPVAPAVAPPPASPKVGVPASIGGRQPGLGR